MLFNICIAIASFFCPRCASVVVDKPFFDQRIHLAHPDIILVCFPPILSDNLKGFKTTKLIEMKRRKEKLTRLKFTETPLSTNVDIYIEYIIGLLK